MDCMEKIMQQVVINIKDDSKLELFLKFIKHLDFVEINKKKESKEEIDNSLFDNLFGIWKNRDINVEEIRNKAWKQI